MHRSKMIEALAGSKPGSSIIVILPLKLNTCTRPKIQPWQANPLEKEIRTTPDASIPWER